MGLLFWARALRGELDRSVPVNYEAALRLFCIHLNHEAPREVFQDLTKAWEASAASNHSLAGDRWCFGVS